jgi:hypothetical protein
MMRRGRFILIAAALLCVAADTVGVPGSHTRFPTAIDATVAGKPVRLALTGVALRTRLVFSVYTIASYLREGVPVRTPEQLLDADAVKALNLVMERDVSGPDITDAIRTGIRLNHRDGFADELAQVDKLLRDQDLRKGRGVMLTWVPKVGLRWQLTGQPELFVKNPAFARAVWEIYFGRHSIDEHIKAALVARL